MTWRHAVAQAAFVLLVVVIPVMGGLLWMEHRENAQIKQIVEYRQDIIRENCRSDNRMIVAFNLTHPHTLKVSLADCEAIR